MFQHMSSSLLNPHCPDQELHAIACKIHAELGYSPQDNIAFHDVSKFESALDLRIVIFHRSCSGKLEVYKTTDELHKNTVHLYLHDGHYKFDKKFEGVLRLQLRLRILLSRLQGSKFTLL